MSDIPEQMIPMDRAGGNGHKPSKAGVNQLGREINVELAHTLDTLAISENELFTEKLHNTINDTSEHGDPIRNTNAGALWTGTAHTLAPDDGKFPSEHLTPMDRTGDNGCRPFNARERALIVDQFDRVRREKDEVLFTYKLNYITSDTSDHRNLIKNMIAGTLQAGTAHILASVDGKVATAIDQGYQNEEEIQGQTRQHSRSNTPLVTKPTYK